MEVNLNIMDNKQKVKYVVAGFIAFVAVLLVVVAVFACEKPVEPSCEETQSCEQPTPTPCPDCGPGNTPENPHTNTTEAPSAPTCNIPFSPPVINNVKVETDGSITWSWLESDGGIDHYSITYGKDPANLIYGVVDIGNVHSFNVKGLDLSTASYAQVWAWKGGCAAKSNTFDP